jgi:hypothetical protein
METQPPERKTTTVRFQQQRWDLIERAAAARGMRASQYVQRAAEALALQDQLAAYQGDPGLRGWIADGEADTATTWSRLS